MAANTQEILDTILGRLKSLASSETVVGAPVTVGDMTILPVVKISVGFGAGAGGGDETGLGKGSGSGGGGGAAVSPIGFLVFDGADVKFVSVAGKGKLDSLFESVPELIKKFSAMKGKKEDGKEKGDEA